MAYRNKTYVAFASEDINQYWLMTAWRKNTHIEFDFIDAHDINTARDTSQPETIRRRLGERLSNTKQAVVLLTASAKRKAGLRTSFFYYEIEAINRLKLPVVFANLNGSRLVQNALLPATLAAPYYTVSVSFQPRIVQFALDNYVPAYQSNSSLPTPRVGPHKYNADIYKTLGL